LENNDDAIISFEDLARDYESVEVVEILNGKAQSLLLILYDGFACELETAVQITK
jgi:hypothetical protein